MDTTGENRSRQRFAGQLSAHRGRIFAWVMHRVGADRAVAEDVTQDCFVRVWETRFSNPPPPGALHSYLLTTAQNLLRDRFRRRSVVAGVDLAHTRMADSETPEARFLLRETVERLAAEAALMPFVLRETLRLRVEEGLDYPVIAARMDCPVGTVKSRLHAARDRLRTALKAQETLPTAVTLSAHAAKLFTVSSDGHETTIYKEQKTMTNSTDTTSLRAQVQAMEARLSALEGGTRSAKDDDPWDASSKRLKEELDVKRRDKGSAFALGLVHMVTQSASTGNAGTAFGLTTFESVADLPDDKTIIERVERMRLLTADPVIARVFRHFYALRFAGKLMRATTEELAEATGETPEKITAVLHPLLSKRNLLFVQNGDGAQTYEWEGYDAAIATLLFAAT